MAEVLGVVAAALSLVEVARKATKSLRALKATVDDVPKEVDQMLTELQRMSDLCAIVQRHHEEADLATRISHLDILRNIQECEVSVSKLHEVIQPLASGDDKNRIIRLKQYLTTSRRQDEMKRLAQYITRTRENLDITVSTELL